MKQLKLGISMLLFVLVLVYAIAFSANNSTAVNVDLLTGAVIQGPLSLWLGAMLLLGAVAGYLLSWLSKARQSLELRRLRREVKQLQERASKPGL
ncbi:hypothetical protein CHH28_17635 [Bacterioplanes sanyensis]|uniref:Lipopolysaccharide assembly protein A domain-containing protein n=1 Tax=Bacterioplanes sanyensis TaxID=1249553 RepID=A0A222FPC5_9GAMM|nr:LapA family protein [Bacterioplanes sanyensis]ASP40386.1 hypothetical protein CHH28_17635 [Bacterioplanes sanyensis]